MTVAKLVKRLASNATTFAVAGETEKAAACLELLALVKVKNFVELRGAPPIEEKVEA